MRELNARELELVGGGADRKTLCCPSTAGDQSYKFVGAKFAPPYMQCNYEAQYRVTYSFNMGEPVTLSENWHGTTHCSTLPCCGTGRPG